MELLTAVTGLSSSTTMVSKLEIGKPAPQFRGIAVVDGRLKEISLSAYTEANHWLILVFFPKAWSFICPTEIKAFSARLDEFLYKRSCAVAFASTDNEHSLKAWNGTCDMDGGLGGVHVPLISDANHKISRDYGVLIEEEGIAQRALFIIDPKGKLRNITINDADVGRSVDEAQRVLDALIFKDEFGEGCPIDWKKGDKGIDVKTKTSIDGPIEVGKRSWTEWARPKLQRAFSGASSQSMLSASTTPIRPGHNERTRSHSNLGSGSHSPLVSPRMQMSGTFQNQLDEALNAQKNVEAQMENMQAALQNQRIGVAT